MGSRKKAKYATAPSRQEHVPPSTTTSVGYTSSYMIVQELSPPLSSPPPSFSNAEQIHEFPNGTGASRSGPSRPRTEHGQTTRSVAPERSVAQSQKAAEIETRAQPGASCSERGDTQQTTKLIKVLVRNKASLYNCIAEDKDEDEEECKEIMRRISVAVKDDRFQTWRQVKSWTMRHYRRRLRSIKSLPPKANRKSNLSLPWKSFDKNLVPLLKVAEMAINTRVFLSSVIDAIGKRKLTRIFKHRLSRDELPEDIAPLIFSPLYLRMCERRTRELKSARNSARNDNESESDDSDDEWSDSEEEDDLPLDEDSNRADGSVAVPGTQFHILPSIEEENNDHGEDEPLDSATGQKTGEPLTVRGSESCATEVRMSRKSRRRNQRRKSRRRMGRDERGTGDNDVDRRRRRRTLTSPCLSNPCDDSARRPALSPPRVQNRTTERARSRKGRSELPSPSALRIRPFADIMSPSATITPDPDIGSLFRMKDLFNDENERSKGTSLSENGAREATTSTKQGGTDSAPKKTATKDRDKEVAISNGLGGSERTSQPKGGPIPGPHRLPPVRQTPAILTEENKRQARKLAKPLAPTMIPSRVPRRKRKSPLQTRRVHKEVLPKVFYSSSAGHTTAIPRVNPEAQVEGTSQPKQSEYALGAKGGRSTIENKENWAKDSSVVPSNIRRQRSSSHQSSRSDETNLPSIEELYKHLILERTQHQSSALAQIRPETTKRKGDDKKRRGREASSEHHGLSAKRIKMATGRSLLPGSEMTRWARDVAHANLQMNDGQRRGGGPHGRTPTFPSRFRASGRDGGGARAPG